MSPTETLELVSAAEEMTNAMGATWRELFPLPFELEPFLPPVELVAKPRRWRKVLTQPTASA